MPEPTSTPAAAENAAASPSPVFREPTGAIDLPVAPGSATTSPEPVAAADQVAGEPADDAATETVPATPAPAAPAGRSVPVTAAAATDDDDEDDAEPDPVAWSSPPPKDRNNRRFGFFVVLAASGVFEVLYLVVLAILVILLAGASTLGSAMASFLAGPVAWLPVAVFFVFYALCVLLFNRAGRFAYVFGSLIVGAIVYAGTVGGILLIDLGELKGDTAALAQYVPGAFSSPVTIAAGFVAREVMLWTGMAVAKHARRVKEQNRAARAEYDAAFEPGRTAA